MQLVSVLRDARVETLNRRESVAEGDCKFVSPLQLSSVSIVNVDELINYKNGRSLPKAANDSAVVIETLFKWVDFAVAMLKSWYMPTPSPPLVIPPKPSVIVPDVPAPGPRVSPGRKPKDIWGGFRQGPDGNCVTVSAIKAAMMRFGQKPTDIFTDVKPVGGGFEVVMRDGFKLQLSTLELQMGTSGSQFQGYDQDMLNDAYFLFAVSAKRAQMENNDGTAARSFEQAIKTLNDGEYSREGLLRLGLKNHIKTVSLSDLLNGMIGTIERRGHSVAVIEGVEELWGERGGTPYKPETITGLV